MQTPYLFKFIVIRRVRQNLIHRPLAALYAELVLHTVVLIAGATAPAAAVSFPCATRHLLAYVFQPFLRCGIGFGHKAGHEVVAELARHPLQQKLCLLAAVALAVLGHVGEGLDDIGQEAGGQGYWCGRDKHLTTNKKYVRYISNLIILLDKNKKINI